MVTCTPKPAQPNPDWDTIISKQGLVNIRKMDSTLQVELRYSSTNNFMGKDVYGTLETAYLQSEAAQMLVKAHAILKENHPDYNLLIYDAARPRRIQQILWDVVDLPENEKSNYVANPLTGSIHNYGCAVDLTIVDGDKIPLDMGTGYDDFTERAHTDNEAALVEQHKLTPLQVENRHILRDVMRQAGFLPLDTEWWHFDAFPRQETKTRFTIIE